MKRIIYSLIISAIFSVAPVVYADAQSLPAPGSRYLNKEYAGGDHHGKYRHGHYDDDDDDDYEDYYKHQKKAYKKYRKAQKKYYKERRKYYNRHNRYHSRLPEMVRRASRGGRDVRVWQVSPDTYVVKYYQRGRWCERYLYPESNRYGNVRFCVSADPMRGWQLIPSLEFNFSL